MTRYKKLPPPEVLKIHGVLSLKRGWYKTGKVADGPTEADIVLHVTKDEATWYRNGKYNREDGPAREYADGRREWYLNGERHREYGPAIEHANGSREWHLNDKLHREDGPAIEKSDGSRVWCRNGYYHREDGPAYEWAGGFREWFLDGQPLNISTLEELQAELVKRESGTRSD